MSIANTPLCYLLFWLLVFRSNSFTSSPLPRFVVGGISGVMDPNELEFLAESELVTIVPRFRMESVDLMEAQVSDCVWRCFSSVMLKALFELHEVQFYICIHFKMYFCFVILMLDSNTGKCRHLSLSDFKSTQLFFSRLGPFIRTFPPMFLSGLLFICVSNRSVVLFLQVGCAFRDYQSSRRLRNSIRAVLHLPTHIIRNWPLCYFSMHWRIYLSKYTFVSFHILLVRNVPHNEVHRIFWWDVQSKYLRLVKIGLSVPF